MLFICTVFFIFLICCMPTDFYYLAVVNRTVRNTDTQVSLCCGNWALWLCTQGWYSRAVLECSFQSFEKTLH